MMETVPTTTTKDTSGGGRNARRRERTRSSLIAAGRHLFATRGFESTTIAEIAEQADIGVGSFYNYFKTKEELVAALLEESLTEQERLLRFRQEQVTDVAERVSIAHRHLLEAAATDPDWGWLLVRLDVRFLIVDRVLREPATQDLERGIASGRFRTADPAVTLHASGGALIAVMHAMLRGVIDRDAGAAHAEGVLRTYGLDPAEAAEIAHRPLPELPEPTGEVPE